MAFLSLNSLKLKENILRRNDVGCKSFAFPTGLDNEQKLLHPQCATCSKLNTHNICKAITMQPNHGESRYNDVADINRFTIDDLDKLQASIHLLDHIANGKVGNDVLFNVGASGNNADQFIDYEIVSATGSFMTIKGRNPKNILIGSLRVNPEWPLPDPTTGLTSRLIAEGNEYCLPIAASVEFIYPSVLTDKLQPIIIDIAPPASDDLENLTFNIQVNANVSRAKTAYDAFYPAEKYYCRIRFQALAQADYRNFQQPKESAFVQKSITINTAAVHSLTNTQDSISTRVLYPSHYPKTFSVIQNNKNGLSEKYSASQIEARLATTQSGLNTWSVTFDTSDLDFVNIVDDLSVSYYCEATALDPINGRIFVQSSCSNSQTEATGSYAHSNGEHCTRIESDKFDNFQAGCWQPDCDGFSLGDETNAIGNHSLTPRNVGDPSWWSALWTRETWYVKLGIPGLSNHRNFQLVLPSGGGASIESLCGSWRDSVSGTYISTTERFFPSVFGSRKIWTDDGNYYQGLVHGAFFHESYEFPNNGPSYEWDAASGTAPEDGVVSGISGWAVKENQMGNNKDSTLAEFPYRAIGGTRVYEFQNTASGMDVVQEKIFDADTFIVNTNFLAEDPIIANSLRTRFQ